YFVSECEHWDVRALLLLWQVGLVGENTYEIEFKNRGLPLLLAKLEQAYGSDHLVSLYTASRYPIRRAETQTIAIGAIREKPISPVCLMMVPPKCQFYRQQLPGSRTKLP